MANKRNKKFMKMKVMSNQETAIYVYNKKSGSSLFSKELFLYIGFVVAGVSKFWCLNWLSVRRMAHLIKNVVWEIILALGVI